MYQKIKRLSDIFFSALGLICLSPVFAALCAVIKLTSPGPVFFRQRRVGKNKKLFTMLKFRTMRTDTPSDMPTHLLKDPFSYITPVGRFLRKTSLDELPQLLNILKGDMSIVGPRPALWNQSDLIAERDLYGANNIRPGLTGLAQVSGRDELPIPVKAGLDGEYHKNISASLDFLILRKTIKSVANGSGISEGGPRKTSADSHECVHSVGEKKD